MRLPFLRGEPATGENFLLCTFDSCRYDTYVAAKTPVLDRYGEARRAYTHGTYTFPAHQSMFAGFLPHVFEEEAYYNRFVRQLWCVKNRPAAAEPLVSFPRGTRTILHGFNDRGYRTLGVAAMGWFMRTSPLRDGFQSFEKTETDAAGQVQLVCAQLARLKGQPFFAFINFGEAHRPYTCRGLPELPPERRRELGDVRNRTTKGVRQQGWTFMEDIFRRQVACVGYLDSQMGELLDRFDRVGISATVVVCGDHGECLGEDGLYGHGFYHPKVMEVPMLIFRHRAGAPPGEGGPIGGVTFEEVAPPRRRRRRRGPDCL